MRDNGRFSGLKEFCCSFSFSTIFVTKFLSQRQRWYASLFIVQCSIGIVFGIDIIVIFPSPDRTPVREVVDGSAISFEHLDYLLILGDHFQPDGVQIEGKQRQLFEHRINEHCRCEH